jgi:F0F1-type ATP synthase membrane subunit b/b'
MEINVVELVVQVGALGVLLVLLWKVGGPMVSRLMDNLDANAKTNIETARVLEASARAQDQVAANLGKLCERMDKMENREEDRERDTQEFRTKTVEALQELSGVVRGMQQQLMKNDARSLKQYEQQLAHADERHAEIITALQELSNALKALNGKT